MLNEFKSDPEFRELMMEAFLSSKFYAQTFLPEMFYSPFSGMHDQIFELIDSDAPRIAIAAPRGFGKTSIVVHAYAGRKVMFQDKDFITYVSNSATSGELQTENLKFELTTNKILRKVFGPIKTKKGAFDGFDEVFSKQAWVSAGGTMVFPRGSGQQVRGVLYHSKRPDLIIVDDLEKAEELMNEEIRAKIKTWFWGDLMKCVSRYDKNWKVIYIDTLKHEDSLLQDLLDSSDWESLRLEICDDNLKSLAPEVMTDEEVAIEHASHKEKGMLDVFYREFRNLPVSKEDATFKPSYFRHYQEADIIAPKVGAPPLLLNIVIVDPAKTPKIQSADSAVVGVGVDRTSQKIYVRDIVNGKMYPDELYDAMFEMVIHLKAFLLAVEVTSLEQFIVQPIKNEMRVRKIYPQFEPLKAQGKKEERIAKLASYYRLGYIYHNVNVCNVLESQLISFPRSKNWDVMDALAYLVKLLEIYDYYFDPIDPPEDPEIDEYAELDEYNDKPMKYKRLL